MCVTYPFDKTLRQEPYRSLNPTGRVPTLEIDDVVLTESGAIAEYLCERFPQAGLGRDPSHTERAQWLNWIHFAETISQHTAALTQQHIVLYETQCVRPLSCSWKRSACARRLATVDQSVDGGVSALGFSAADIGVGQAVYMARHFVHFDDLPALARWYARSGSASSVSEVLAGWSRTLCRRFMRRGRRRWLTTSVFIEVGPRDGLQNEPGVISVAARWR